MPDCKSGPPPLKPGAARLVLTVWLTVCVALSVRTLLHPDSHTVFPVLATAAEHWTADRPLYADYRPIDYFRYPPAFAVLVWPLAVLGLRGGGVLWAWLNLTVYGAGLWSFVRTVPPGRWTSNRQASFLLLGLFGGLRGLWNGQSNALVTGLLLLGCVALVRRRWWAATVPLTGAVLVKWTPLAPVLLLASLWPRRLAGRLTVGLAVLLALPFLTRPPSAVLEQYHGWVRQWGELSGERWPGFRDAWTVRLVVGHAFEDTHDPVDLRGPLQASGYRCVQVLTALAALAFCLQLRRRVTDARTRVTLTLGVGTGWLLLFGPASEHPTYVFIAPLLAWGVTQRRLWPRGRPLILAAALLVLVLGWGSLTSALSDASWTLLPLPIGCGLLLVWLVGLSLTASRLDFVVERDGGSARLEQQCGGVAA
jgi:hypothetical protein